MKRNYFSELPLNLTYQLAMNKEKIIAVAGLCITLLVYFLQKDSQQILPLLIISAAGLIVSFQFILAGNTLILFGGASLIVYSFLYSASPGYAIGGALLTYAPIVILIKWWKQNEK